MDNSIVPSALDVEKSNNELVQIECDELTVTYTGGGRHKEDFGWTQANYPVPRNLNIYYFELKVLNVGYTGHISIGFAPSPHKTLQLGNYTVLFSLSFSL